jgi:hypothetical protein
MSPTRLNFTGIELPALATFKIGWLSTGLKKPLKSKLMVTLKVPEVVLLVLSVAVQVTLVLPTGKLLPEAGVQLTGCAPSTRSVAVAV